jgi:hypothetical protein
MATVRSVYSQCSSTTSRGCKKHPVGRPLDPYPGSMGNTPLDLCGTPNEKTCKVVRLIIDTPAKCSLQSRSAAPLIHAAQNAALRCVNGRRPHCNTSVPNKCQSNYSYTTRQLLHSQGQTYEQKSMRSKSYASCIDNECAVPQLDKDCGKCNVQSMNARRENNTLFGTNQAVDTGLYISAVALGQSTQAECDCDCDCDCDC